MNFEWPAPLAPREPTHGFRREGLRSGPPSLPCCERRIERMEERRWKGLGLGCRLGCLDSTLSAAKNTPTRAIYSPRTCPADVGLVTRNTAAPLR